MSSVRPTPPRTTTTRRAVYSAPMAPPPAAPEAGATPELRGAVPIYADDPPPRPSTVRLVARPVTVTRAAPRYPDNRWDQLIAEGFGLLLAYAMWFANALFTIWGLMALGVPWLLGGLIHIGISRWQQTLWRGQFHPLVALLGIGCVLLDLGTTLIGMVHVVTWRYPTFAAGMPTDLRLWAALLAQPTPPWAWQAVLLVSFTLLLTLSSEYLIRVFWQRCADAWDAVHAR